MKSEQTLKNYDIVSKIAEGGFGILYKARKIGTQNIFAIKQIKNILDNNEKYLQSIINEIEVFKKIKGLPNTLDLVDIEINDSNNFCLVYKYYEYDMDDLIYRGGLASVDQMKSYFKQMVTGLNGLHSKKIIHQDVKPANFLISYNNEVKITDFGISQNINNINNTVGTLVYTAPEIVLGKTKYGTETDVWSLGCTFFEMLTHEPLFQKCQTFEQYARRYIQLFGFPSKKDWPEFYSFPNANLFLKHANYSQMTFKEFLDIKLNPKYKVFKKLLIKMINPLPTKRASLKDILKDSIFKDLEKPEMLPKIFINETKKCNNKHTVDLKKLKDTFEQMQPEKIFPK